MFSVIPILTTHETRLASTGERIVIRTGVIISYPIFVLTVFFAAAVDGWRECRKVWRDPLIHHWSD
jgi:hypothetical protein